MNRNMLIILIIVLILCILTKSEGFVLKRIWGTATASAIGKGVKKTVKRVAHENPKDIGHVVAGVPGIVLYGSSDIAGGASDIIEGAGDRVLGAGAKVSKGIGGVYSGVIDVADKGDEFIGDVWDEVTYVAKKTKEGAKEKVVKGWKVLGGIGDALF